MATVAREDGGLSLNTNNILKDSQWLRVRTPQPLLFGQVDWPKSAEQSGVSNRVLSTLYRSFPARYWGHATRCDRPRGSRAGNLGALEKRGNQEPLWHENARSDSLTAPRTGQLHSSPDLHGPYLSKLPESAGKFLSRADHRCSNGIGECSSQAPI